MGGINSFGEEDFGGRDFDFDNENEDDGAAEFRNAVDALLEHTDRQLAVACGDIEDDEKVRSIVGQHFQGRALSSKQRWCLAAYCVDNNLLVGE